MKTDVALEKSKDHITGVGSVLSHYKKDLQKRLATVSEIVIKLNFVSAYIELATTPFLAVKAFVDFILPFYKGKIIIAEESTIGNAQEAFDSFGFTEYAKDISQVELRDLSDDKTITKRIAFHGIHTKLKLSQTLINAPLLVSIVRPKTHDFVVATLGIKNVLVGAINHRKTSRQLIHRGKYINGLMAEIAHFVFPDFTLIDGTDGMEGDGPVGGDPTAAGWAIASFDSLVADSLGAYLMGFDHRDIGYLNLLKDRRFGALFGKDEINVIGENPKRLRVSFKPHQTIELQKQWK